MPIIRNAFRLHRTICQRKLEMGGQITKFRFPKLLFAMHCSSNPVVRSDVWAGVSFKKHPCLALMGFESLHMRVLPVLRDEERMRCFFSVFLQHICCFSRLAQKFGGSQCCTSQILKLGSTEIRNSLFEVALTTNSRFSNYAHFLAGRAPNLSGDWLPLMDQ